MSTQFSEEFGDEVEAASFFDHHEPETSRTSGHFSGLVLQPQRLN